MAVLLRASARVVTLSATGPYGRAQLDAMRGGGTRVVAGVSAGRGGGALDGVPLFDTVAEAVAATGADTAVIYTPAIGCGAAIAECADAGIGLALAAAEFVPLHDSLKALAYAREAGMWVVGPNTAGMATPGQAILGSIPQGFTAPGRIGLVGRSGTLTMTVARIMSAHGLGQSTVTHIGGDMLAGRNPHEWAKLYLDDPDTDILVYCGEIGGAKEYALLDLIAARRKPVIAFIVGRSAPPGKRMGHAGALVGADRETAAAKAAALAEAGAIVATSPYAIVERLRELVPAAG
ncbi:succinate--CoA ligase subunit alpha [Chelatococcus reniformis]|uniref:Succinate--CoA ligase [ADP-forming] subunit alpha n=1 Tax=Chelatococcus reniformis TaxID=1494448 RepID=A0A916XKR9_9HYPH|nr:CoA-binding protein [Chelatococcus reniformis]GGC78030.1 succinate--CoA ligase [ADP-forming] subunit alpha [Chelatococcus reniformis]